MKNAKKDRDPEKARARALADLNCATRKLEAACREHGDREGELFFRLVRERAPDIAGVAAIRSKR